MLKWTFDYNGHQRVNSQCPVC